MQRIIYTTCGTSLLKSNCWEGISKKKALIECKPFENRIDHEREYTKFINEHGFSKKNPDALANLFDLNVWKDPSQITRLPAELASLKTIKMFFDDNKPPGPLGGGDKLILLHAENEEAIFCAEVIHKVLKDKRLFEDVQIDLIPINELDPKYPEKFGKALIRFWEKLHSDMPFQEEPKIKYFLNLTGGYKATVILLGCFAYVKGASDTRIFYLNEESGREVLVIGFDPSKPLPGGFSLLKQGYIEAGTGKISGDIATTEL